MECRKHNWKSDADFFNPLARTTCPYCEKEAEQHKSILESQERASEIAEQQIEEQRRFAEQQAEAAEALLRQQEMAADEAMQARKEARELQQEMLAVAQQRAEEERSHRELEETRSALRAGLPEFSEDFRTRWYQVASDKKQLDADTATFEGEVHELEQEIGKANQEMKQLVEVARYIAKKQVRGALDSALKTRAMTPSLVGLQEASIGKRIDGDTLTALYQRIFSESVGREALSRRSTAFAPLPRISTPYELILGLLDISFLPDSEGQLSWGCATVSILWALFMLFVAFIVVVPAVARPGHWLQAMRLLIPILLMGFLPLVSFYPGMEVLRLEPKYFHAAPG